MADPVSAFTSFVYTNVSSDVFCKAARCRELVGGGLDTANRLKQPDLMPA
jgi:hypothetical protein